MKSRCRQACETCRVRKSRCLPGTSERRCKRCEESDSQCVPHEAIKRRPRRPPSSSGVEEAPVAKHASGTLGRAFFNDLDINDTTFTKWLTCSGQSLEQVEVFLGQYSRMAQVMPFAIQTPSMNIAEFSTDYPILLLAMMLTGSSSDLEFEKEADILFRQVLADRVIVKGKKSLELLQSLLTYMAWYHHRFDPESNQFYQFLQLANGMVVDLGLPIKFARTEAVSIQLADSLNEARAFLLCYYLNCGGGVLGYDRAENMGCIESLRNAAKLLADTSPRPQDREAPAVVRLLYIVAHHHGASKPSNLEATSSTAGASLLKRWETTHLHAETSATLSSSFHFITAYTLLKSCNSKRPSPEVVHTCVHHFQELLKNVLNQKLAYLIEFGIVEWAHLITTLFLLARLGSSGSIDATEPQRPLVHEYVGHFRLLAHNSRTHAQRDKVFDAPHLLGWLERILAAVTERAISRETSRKQSAAEIGHQGSAYELVNSFLKGDKTEQTHSWQDPAMLHSEINVDGEDFWSEFMSEWLTW